ncbi:MAG: Undecaprenyl-phosphate 4-deoxy-4-formamido-L-arabinose transferase [bacterium]|nr:Undecaprenyl-phosphate 4-deoxy-4-formamido-L-arabinose transferase [bacterium]
MTRRLQVVLPSFNEEIALSRLFPQFEELAARLKDQLSLLVVDDGSSDDTARVAEEWEGKVPVGLVRFPRNRGYGAALETGVTESARELACSDLIATMDADDTHPPRYLANMVKALDEEGLEVVIASRYAPGAREEGVSWDRRLLSRGASFFYQWAFHLPHVRDYSCGYRLFKAGLIQDALRGGIGGLGLDTGFHATGQLLLRLREQTSRIGEVPFELHYERKPTPSKMRKLQTVLGTLKYLREVRRTVAKLPK